MQKEDIIAKVNLFLVDEFELDEEQLVPDALLKDDLDIESLDFVDIAVLIEKEFKFQMKTEEMAKLKTLNDFYNYLDQQLNKYWLPGRVKHEEVLPDILPLFLF